MNRRHFFHSSAATSIACFFPTRLSAETATDYQDLFISDNPQALALARRVMKKCVLDKVRKPQPPLNHDWIIDG
jgi:hypothetical protein